MTMSDEPIKTRFVQKILVPVDFSEPSRAALQYAIDLADPLGASIDVIHAYDVPAMASGSLVLTTRGVNRPFADWKLQRAKHDVDEFVRTVNAGVPLTTVVVEGSPAPAVQQYAKEHAVDLIVIATRGRSQVARVLLGSVADRVVRTAPCPVLTVRAD